MKFPVLKNSPTTYGAIAKMFHWVMAIGIIGLLCLGFYMEGLPPEPSKFALYGLHKSFGITILILIFARAAWRSYTGAPGHLDAHKKWERYLATIVHYALYAAACLMPLTGWAMSSAGGHSVSLFGLPLPPITQQNEQAGAFFNGAHSVLAWVIIALVALHVLGASKHHFIDKDTTLKRMLP